MNPYQKQIKKFCHERNWGQFFDPKDLLLGIVEEVGELRNFIKWARDPKIIKKVLLENIDEVKDNIGDIFWFLALLANSCDIDIDEAIQEVIRRNEKRFPVKKTKNRHTNIYLGGHNGQYR